MEQGKSNGANIVLMGMPGSGKSTVGLLLAEKLKMGYLDIDCQIEEKFSLSIADLFLKHGEQFFREVETETVIYSSQQKNMVIATGGGVVMKEINMVHLRKTGIIIYLKRSCADILKTADLSKRPLLASHTEKIYQLYGQRKGLYERYADITINNENSLEMAADYICEVLYETNGDKWTQLKSIR